MPRSLQRAQPGLYAAIGFSTVAIFIFDVYSPLGLAIWLLYLIPVMMTAYSWRRHAALITAMLVTVLLVLGYFLSPPGINPMFAQINRVFGAVTLWVVAVIVSQAIQNKTKVRQQEWMQTGQAQLSARMAGEQKLHELGENVLKFMAEYLGPEMGVLYMHGEGTVFHLEATYALQPVEAAPASFESGVGLLGQAAKDYKLTVVRDVPEGYLSTGSGLGQRRPRQLLIIPTVTDKIVKSVIELGFFHDIDETTVEFARRVSESIAVAVRSAKYRARLERLLHETQQQAGELQQQSEELRVTNEELEEQSRALKEAQTKLEQQHSELEQTNANLEEQTQVLSRQKDELTRAKTALETQARELERASRYKSDFLANMSHELRTPLNSSLILAKLLADNRGGNLTPEQIKYARTIYDAGNDLLLLINDVLDLSKVEAGRLDVKPKAVRIAEVIDSVRNTFAAVAQEKQLSFELRIENGTREEIETDPQRLEQVLRNLVSNAIKFTQRGGVAVTVRNADDGHVAFTVRDTGIGISTENQKLIFEPFQQAGGADHALGGTGLGLSISRELMKLLGGRIALESDLGRGSTFTVTLPVNFPTKSAPPLATLPPSPAAAPKPVAPRATTESAAADDRQSFNPQARSILIIEDDEVFARILHDLGHEIGFQVLVARNADEGLRLAAEFTPSAIVLDLGLPDTIGLSVLDRIKNNPQTRHIPVHIVSGADHTEAAYAMGAAGYMLKPVKRDALLDTLHKLEAQLAQKVRRVLVIEDDAVQRESVRQLLAGPNVEIVMAADARQSLEQLRTTTFDCVVLDLSLPDTSGLALLETLNREPERYSFPPVIIYTGRDLSHEEEEQLRRYTKAVIVKGAKSPERLLDEVTLFLHQVVAKLPVDRQRMLEKARGRDAALEGRRLLIVEDDVRNVFALTSVLEPRGLILKIARNGREALEAVAQATAAGEPIDLVLMDVMMPEMDGLTATRELRKRPEGRKLPIIVLTAKATRNDQAECIAAGASDYIAKPLDVDKLLSLVRVWMPR